MELNNLCFADDIVFISNNLKDLKIMAEDQCRESKKAGLSVNIM